MVWLRCGCRCLCQHLRHPFAVYARVGWLLCFASFEHLSLESIYQLFQQSVTYETKETCPDADENHLDFIIRQLWLDLDEKQKAKYIERQWERHRTTVESNDKISETAAQEPDK